MHAHMRARSRTRDTSPTGISCQSRLDTCIHPLIYPFDLTTSQHTEENGYAPELAHSVLCGYAQPKSGTQLHPLP